MSTINGLINGAVEKSGKEIGQKIDNDKSEEDDWN